MSPPSPFAAGLSPSSADVAGAWWAGRWPHLLPLILLVFVGLVAEGRNVLRVGFLSDDLILLSCFDSGEAGLLNPRFWMHRPLGLAPVWALYHLFGCSAPMHQAAVIVIQLLCGFLVYALAWRLTGEERVWPTVVAALFLVYPLDETVPWVSFAAQRVNLALWLGATLLLLRRRGRLLGPSHVVALLLLAVTVYSNEMFLTLALATAVAVVLAAPHRGADRRSWVLAAGTMGVVASYLIWRFVVGPRLPGAWDRRAGDFVTAPVHWLQQALSGLRVPLATSWTFANSRDPFGLEVDGAASVLAIVGLMALGLVAGLWVIARGACRLPTPAAAARRAVGGLLFMILAMLPYLPTTSDLGYSVLTATRAHYTLNLGAAMVLASLVLLLAAVVGRLLGLSPAVWQRLFAVVCVLPMVLGALVHRRVAREYGEITDAQRHLACALWRAVPSLSPDSYVLLHGIRPFHYPLQPLDAQWTVKGILQLLYGPGPLDGTVYVEGAIADSSIGQLAAGAADSAQTRDILSRLVILRYTDGGFVQTREMPEYFVRRGLPPVAGSVDRVHSQRRTSKFLQQYLCGCRAGAWPAPGLSAEPGGAAAMPVLGSGQGGASAHAPSTTEAGAAGASSPSCRALRQVSSERFPRDDREDRTGMEGQAPFDIVDALREPP